MSQGHGSNGTHSVGLPLSLGKKNAKQKNVTTYYTLVHSKLLEHGPAMRLKTHVAAPGSTKSDRLTTKQEKGSLVCMCTSTESVGTGICVEQVERGGPKWPITMLNHRHKLTVHTI